MSIYYTFARVFAAKLLVHLKAGNLFQTKLPALCPRFRALPGHMNPHALK